MTASPAALSLLLALAAPAAGPAPSPAAPAWERSFEKDTTTKDRGTYVHVFWNAQEARAALSGPDRATLLARAAWRAASGRFPAKATADRVVMDVVFVKERDSYGMPRWDTLEKVAHLEFSRRKVLDGLPAGAVPKGTDPVRLFDVFQTPR